MYVDFEIRSHVIGSQWSWSIPAQYLVDHIENCAHTGNFNFDWRHYKRWYFGLKSDHMSSFPLLSVKNTHNTWIPIIQIILFRRANSASLGQQSEPCRVFTEKFPQKKLPDLMIKIGFLRSFLGKPDFRRVPGGLLTKCPESSFSPFTLNLSLIGLFWIGNRSVMFTDSAFRENSDQPH
jgi:hypothetical protein